MYKWDEMWRNIQHRKTSNKRKLHKYSRNTAIKILLSTVMMKSKKIKIENILGAYLKMVEW